MAENSNMIKIFSLLLLTFSFVFCAHINSAAAPARMINRIEGQVYDEKRNPVYNAFVELYNDVGSSAGRTRTSTQGRFSFLGMGPGRYNVRVLPLGTNLLEDSKDVEIVNLAARSDFVYVDFVLRINRRMTNIIENTSTEAIYAQDIPSDAKKLFKSGVDKLDDQKEEGLADLAGAIGKFPIYFDALSRLGREYVTRKKYEDAYPILIRAIDVNQRCVSCYYSLSYAFYQLKEIPAAIEAAKGASILDQSSSGIQLLLGTLLRIDGNSKDAEKALLKSRALTKSPNVEINWQLALLYNKLNRNAEAARELENFLKDDPRSPDKQKVLELIAKLKSTK